MRARPENRSLVAEIAGKTGYRFRDAALLVRSLTHRSLSSHQENYEALEFLGDRILAAAIAESLYRARPSAGAGELAQAINRLVCADTLAEVAGEIGIAELMRTGAGEATPAGPSVRMLADACEALIAAVYLDGGADAAGSFIRRHWRNRIDRAWLAGKDAKTTLQEWVAARSLAPPLYCETAREGPDHLPSFRVKVSVTGLPPAHGKGSSKRQAEQHAAEVLLRREGVWPSAT